MQTREFHDVEIKAISKKTRGIKVEKDGVQKWVDVDENIDIDKIKKGKATIEVIIDKKPIIASIIYPQEQSPQETKGSPKEDDDKWIKKDKRISRLALLNTSVEIYKLYGGEIDFSKANEKGRKEKVIKEIISIAKELEKWVWED